MRRYHYSIVIPLLAAFTVGLYACGNGGNAVTRKTSHASMHIDWPAPGRAIPHPANYLRIKAFAGGQQLATGQIVQKPTTPNPVSNVTIPNLPVGAMVNFEIKAFAAMPASDTADTDTNGNAFIGIANTPPVQIAQNAANNVVSAEVFSTVAQVLTTPTFANPDGTAGLPISDHTPRGGDVLRLDVVAQDSNGKTVVIDPTGLNWSRIDGASRPTPLLLSSTMKFNAATGVRVIGGAFVYLQCGGQLNTANGFPQQPVSVTEGDSGKSFATPITYRAITTGSAISAAINNTGSSSGGGCSTQNTSIGNTGTLVPSPRPSAGKQTFLSKHKTRGTGSIVAYATGTSTQTVSNCGTGYTEYIRAIYAGDPSGINLTAGPVATEFDVYVGDGGPGNSTQVNSVPPDFNDPVLILNNSYGLVSASLKPNTPTRTEKVHVWRYKALTGGKFQGVDANGVDHKDKVFDSANTEHLFNRVLDIRLAPAPASPTSPYYTYVLDDLGSGNSQIVAFDEQTGMIDTTKTYNLPVANPKRFTIDSFGNLYVLYGTNQIAKVDYSSGSPVLTTFLFDTTDPTTMGYKDIEDISFDSGFIYLLDLTLSPITVRIYTTSGLFAGNATLNGTVNNDKRLSVVGSQIYVPVQDGSGSYSLVNVTLQ